MDIQSKEIYASVKEVIAKCKIEYNNDCREANEHDCYIKPSYYTKFLEKNHDHVRLVEEYMLIQNKISTKSSGERKVIVYIVDAAIELAITKIAEAERVANVIKEAKARGAKIKASNKKVATETAAVIVDGKKPKRKTAKADIVDVAFKNKLDV